MVPSCIGTCSERWAPGWSSPRPRPRTPTRPRSSSWQCRGSSERNTTRCWTSCRCTGGSLMLRSRGIAEPGAASLEVTKMRRRHLRGVMAIERQAYARPWTRNLFVAEMSEPTNRNYLVARIDKDVVGCAGLICYGDEAHITNIAIDPMLQGHGIAHRLLA